MSIPGDDGNNFGNEPAVVGVVFQGYSSKEGGYMIAGEVLKRVISLDDIGEDLRVPELGISTQILENRSLRKSLGLGVVESDSRRPIDLSKKNPRSEKTSDEEDAVTP